MPRNIFPFFLLCLMSVCTCGSTRESGGIGKSTKGNSEEFPLSPLRNKKYKEKNTSNSEIKKSIPVRQQVIEEDTALFKQELKKNTDSDYRTIINGEPLLSFVRDNAMWICELDGSNSKRVLSEPGGDISGTISPDGKSIAYISNEQSNKRFFRHVAVADISSGERKVFREIPGGRNHSPRWLPESNELVFSTYRSGRWTIATVARDGTAFQSLDHRCSSPAWGNGGIYCHTMKSIFFVKEKNIVQEWTWEEILGSLWDRVTDPMTILPSHDGKKLLLVMAREESDIKQISGAVFLYDFDLKELKQITPSRVSVRYADWLPEEDGFVFSGVKLTKENRRRLLKGKYVRPDLYRMNLDGTGMRVIVKNADLPSVSLGRPSEKPDPKQVTMDKCHKKDKGKIEDTEL